MGRSAVIVFSGLQKIEEMRRRRQTKKPLGAIALHQNDPLHSQKGQVRFLLETVFNYREKGLKRSGWFVDLAAGHPTEHSNTYFIERYLGWRGLLIEPNPQFADALRRSRNNPVVESAIVSDSYSNTTIPMRVDNGFLGGLLIDGADNDPKFRSLEGAKVVEVNATTLSNVLSSHKAPQNIDFLSLDIEGSEYEAMRDFDFDAFQFRFICVERLNLQLALLFDEAGYIQVSTASKDTFLIHKNFIGEARQEDLKVRFSTQPPKFQPDK